MKFCILGLHLLVLSILMYERSIALLSIYRILMNLLYTPLIYRTPSYKVWTSSHLTSEITCLRSFIITNMLFCIICWFAGQGFLIVMFLIGYDSFEAHTSTPTGENISNTRFYEEILRYNFSKEQEHTKAHRDKTVTYKLGEIGI